MCDCVSKGDHFLRIRVIISKKMYGKSEGWVKNLNRLTVSSIHQCFGDVKMRFCHDEKKSDNSVFLPRMLTYCKNGSRFDCVTSGELEIIFFLSFFPNVAIRIETTPKGANLQQHVVVCTQLGR